MKIITLFIVLLSIGFISALPNDLNNKIDFKYTSSTSTNYSSINVNNSLFWQGHTGTDGSWLTGISTYNSSYVTYNGATGDVNLNGKSILNVSALVTQIIKNNWFTDISGINQLFLDATLKLYPYMDNFISLGNLTYRFKDGWFSGNVTANRFIGNGSSLTDVCLSNGTNCQANSGGMNYTNIALTNMTINMNQNNITNISSMTSSNSSWGYWSNETCIVIGNINYVNQC